MMKTIWYVNKYFAPATASSPGGRDWNLLEAIAKMNYNIVSIGSDSNTIFDTKELKSIVVKNCESGFIQIYLKTIKYLEPKSLRRILSWFHFELNVLFLDKRKLPSPDVVIVSSLSLLTIMTGIYLKLKFRCKLVVEIRDIWPLTLIEEGGYHRYNPLIIILSIIEKTGYYFADTIVGTMPNLVEHVKSVIKVERPVECIPMGVPHQSLTETAEVSHEFIKEYFNEDYFNVVHAGTIGLTNALSTFFEAAELALCQDDIRFILLGDGVMKDAYKEKYGHLGNVIFAPKVDRKQVQYTLAHADILYLSSFNSKVWDYGQSLNKLVDYMLAGKPIIASYSGYPSMIDEADCGYFIPAEDPISLVEKIKSLKSLPAKERQIMGNRGRDWLIENRNYKKLAEKYISFLFDSKVS